MKYLFGLVFLAGACSGLAFYLNRVSQMRVKEAEAQSQVKFAGMSEGTNLSQPKRIASPQPGAVQVLQDGSLPAPASAALTGSNNNTMSSNEVSQAVDLLISRQASYEEKRAEWKKLKERGSLDAAINQLEQRANNDRTCADCAATLGQAYLQKCGAISDVREQGILAMSADKLFDQALSLDAANWEARFTKAVALSYWPAAMGKGDEVIDEFQTLIQQQETQPQQPQFAESYLWLGDQYQKSGRNDDARGAWSRGVELFPENQPLRNRLASVP